MINIQALEEEGVIIVEPTSALEAEDFKTLAEEIDAFTEDRGQLSGLVIYTRSFPGWDDLDAFLCHMNFVKSNHEKIRRVAIVTDSLVGEIGPKIASYFISAKIKHFDYDDFSLAMSWVQQIG